MRVSNTSAEEALKQALIDYLRLNNQVPVGFLESSYLDVGGFRLDILNDIDEMKATFTIKFVQPSDLPPADKEVLLNPRRYL